MLRHKYWLPRYQHDPDLRKILLVFDDICNSIRDAKASQGGMLEYCQDIERLKSTTLSMSFDRGGCTNCIQRVSGKICTPDVEKTKLAFLFAAS